jgi:hypothetical protein
LWRDIDGRNTFGTDETGRVMTSSKLSSSRRQQLQPLGEHGCAQAMKNDEVTSETEGVFKTLSTHGW